jgi:hypothetical protein
MVMVQNLEIIFGVEQGYVDKCSKFSVIHQVWGIGFAGYINMLVAWESF